VSEARRFVVFGRVQGVGFRAFVWRRAAELGLSGWVRNRRDGSVEILAHGTPEAIEALRLAIEHGPRWSTVSRVDDAGVGEASPPAGFSVLPDR